MKFTILERLRHESKHRREYPIMYENRIFDEYRCEASFEDLFYTWQQLKDDGDLFLEDKSYGDFIIPSSFLERGDDYAPAIHKIYDNEGVNVISKQPHRDEDGNSYVGRLACNVVDVCMLPLDYDGGYTIEQARERFAEYEYILYSSYRHLEDGETHKFRMLIPYETPLLRQQYEERREAILNWIGPDDVDKSCLSLSRGFYMPCFGQHNIDNVVLEYNHGKRLDGLSFAVKKQPEFKPQLFDSIDADYDDILEMLVTTRIDEYDRWWQMVQALKSIGVSLQQVIQITANNPHHASTTTGLKDEALTRDIYNNLAVQDRSIGKLVLMIRETYPDFRKSKNRDVKLKLVNNKLETKLDELNTQLEILKRYKSQ